METAGTCSFRKEGSLFIFYNIFCGVMWLGDWISILFPGGGNSHDQLDRLMSDGLG